MTLAGIIKEKTNVRAIFFETALLIAGTLLLTASAQFFVFVPFSPVPFTFQTFAVLLLGAALGSKRGASCVILYITQGVLGLPVFSGGTAGFIHLAGPTGGYLAGFAFAAYAAGYLAEKKFDRNILKTAALMITGNAVIYAFGFAWLGIYTGYSRALQIGVLPFVVSDLLKIALASLILPSAWKLVGRGERI
ncbi:biotin transporter BioY [candidate division WOR-3 bacterium]|nr:biotin transporter BioY [candidate division WOR-3 bacterium]